MRDEIRAQQMADAFEPFSKLDFTDSKAKVQQNRPLQSGSQTCFLAEFILRGREITIQDCINMLARSGTPSNDAGRRLREARSWIERQGISIITCQHINDSTGARHQSWRIRPNQKLQEVAINAIYQAAIYKMRKTK